MCVFAGVEVLCLTSDVMPGAATIVCYITLQKAYVPQGSLGSF